MNFLSKGNGMIPPFALEPGAVSTGSALWSLRIVHSADIIIYSRLLSGREIPILDKNSAMATGAVFGTQSK